MSLKDNIEGKKSKDPEIDRINRIQDSVRERILYLLKNNRVSISGLAGDCIPKRGQLIRQINDGAAITFLTIQVLIEHFPNLSLDWLLKGEGDEFIKNSVSEEKDKALIDLLNRVSAIERKLNSVY